ncbi:MAG TPA: tetratricopeptide repeat protein [Myxococcota bacterium]
MSSIVIVAVAASLAAAPTSSKELITLGEGLVGRGDGKKAQAHLEKALTDTTLSAADKGRAEAALGLAFLQQKKGKEAIAHLELATQLAPKNDKSWLYLGLAKDQLGDTAGSLEAYRKGVAAAPSSSTLQHELGMALLSAGKNDEGAEVLQKAATKAEQDPELWADAAYALSLVGRFKEAREFASRAVEMSPENPDALYTLGMAEAGLANKKAAKQAFNEAIASDELHVPSQFQLGLLLLDDNDDKGAAARFTQVLKVEPDHARAKAALGASLGRLNPADPQAEKLLRDAVGAEPKLGVAWAGLGDLLARQGKIAEAKKALQAAVKLKPEASWQARLDQLATAKEGTPSLPAAAKKK